MLDSHSQSKLPTAIADDTQMVPAEERMPQRHWRCPVRTCRSRVVRQKTPARRGCFCGSQPCCWYQAAVWRNRSRSGAGSNPSRNRALPSQSHDPPVASRALSRLIINGWREIRETSSQTAPKLADRAHQVSRRRFFKAAQLPRHLPIWNLADRPAGGNAGHDGFRISRSVRALWNWPNPPDRRHFRPNSTRDFQLIDSICGGSWL